jgi:hypothetical protein
MPFRTEVTGIRENKWSTNGKVFETEQEAENWLDGLKNRWFGYDMSRVVPIDTAEGQPVEATQTFYQNFRN